MCWRRQNARPGKTIKKKEELPKQTPNSHRDDEDEDGFPEFDEMVTVDATGIFEEEVDDEDSTHAARMRQSSVSSISKSSLVSSSQPATNCTSRGRSPSNEHPSPSVPTSQRNWSPAPEQQEETEARHQQKPLVEEQKSYPKVDDKYSADDRSQKVALNCKEEVTVKKESNRSSYAEKASVPDNTQKPNKTLKVTQATKPLESQPVINCETSSELPAPIGQQFVIPVTGFFCKLCHKFYNKEKAAKLEHCRTPQHVNKVQMLEAGKISLNTATNNRAQLQQGNKKMQTCHPMNLSQIKVNNNDRSKQEVHSEALGSQLTDVRTNNSLTNHKSSDSIMLHIDSMVDFHEDLKSRGNNNVDNVMDLSSTGTHAMDDCSLDILSDLPSKVASPKNRRGRSSRRGRAK